MDSNPEQARMVSGKHTLRTVMGVIAAAAGLSAVGYALGVFRPVTGCIRSQAWPWELIALHVTGDALTVVPYIGIPFVLVVIIWARLKARPEAKLLYLFGAFILFCGWTHLDDIIAIWWPAYWFTGVIKLATGIVSSATLVKLIQLVPTILAFGTQAADLQAALAREEHLKKEAEARATRAEGEVTELEQALCREKAALAKAGEEKARAEAQTREADRMRREANESARIAEAARTQAEAAISEKLAIQRAVKDLTTPILPLTDRVIVTPLIGALDSARAAQWMDVTLEAVGAHQADIVIVDLSGVPVVDTQVASALLKTVQAVGLVGGKCVVTGIRPAVAQAMVELGIDMTGVITRSTLKAGFAETMRMVKTA